MRMFITSKNKYLSNDMKIFGTCSIPLTTLYCMQYFKSPILYETLESPTLYKTLKNPILYETLESLMLSNTY